jgi:hypothetical protein
MPAASHGFDITKFKTQISNRGTIQTNKFIVEMIPPAITGGSLEARVDESLKLSFRIESIKLPGIVLQTENNYRYGIGPTQKFPTNVLFTDTTISIIEDRNMGYWTLFNNWISNIYNFTGKSHGRSIPNYQLQYKKNYVTDIAISPFNNEGTTGITRQPDLPKSGSVPETALRGSSIILRDAYPTSINDVGLNWDQNNNLFKTIVNFTFKDWYFSDFESAELTGQFLNLD